MTKLQNWARRRNWAKRGVVCAGKLLQTILENEADLLTPGEKTLLGIAANKIFAASSSWDYKKDISKRLFMEKK